jgi:Uma2 family endonuclease
MRRANHREGDATMTLLVTDPDLRRRLIAERRANGSDRFDEAWDGVYVMSPLADDDHQRIVAKLTHILEAAIGDPGLGDVRPGVNVSDRVKGRKANYRCPDVAVRLEGGRARILKNHWYGGPDFAVEVVSRGDRSREKLGFYAAVGVRELLIIDRDPWALELYGLRGEQLVPLGVSRPEQPAELASAVVPLTFRLVPQEGRPKIEVVHVPTGRRRAF